MVRLTYVSLIAMFRKFTFWTLFTLPGERRKTFHFSGVHVVALAARENVFVEINLGRKKKKRSTGFCMLMQRCIVYAFFVARQELSTSDPSLLHKT